jgi:hypothetical protein
MRSGLSLTATGFAASGLLAISFTLCTVFDLILPSYQMHSVWEKLLPGFVWISSEVFSWVWSRASLMAGISP